MENFTAYITSMNFIDWGTPGLVLFILHFMIKKSTIIKWTGIGALLVSAIVLVEFDIGWQAQWIIFFAFILWGLIRNRGSSF
ncbi:MAG: hypothetical protein GY829_02715 [Gammaproteobacteria bacterium]|nr:hypothetical protein [Gammaproteobacteria bacterium]